eukprot:3987817-Lingulodinium_polyedra.AAC.1
MEQDWPVAAQYFAAAAEQLHPDGHGRACALGHAVQLQGGAQGDDVHPLPPGQVAAQSEPCRAVAKRRAPLLRDRRDD